jgi:hypothetical protein
MAQREPSQSRFIVLIFRNLAPARADGVPWPARVVAGPYLLPKAKKSEFDMFGVRTVAFAFAVLGAHPVCRSVRRRLVSTSLLAILSTRPLAPRRIAPRGVAPMPPAPELPRQNLARLGLARLSLAGAAFSWGPAVAVVRMVDADAERRRPRIEPGAELVPLGSPVGPQSGRGRGLGPPCRHDHRAYGSGAMDRALRQ